MRLHVAAFGLITCGSAMALDLKGLEVDKPADCALIAQIQTQKDPLDACTRGGVILVKTTFIGDPVEMYVHRDDASRVTAVRMRDIDFEGASIALSDKFGPPKTNESMVQNRLGASFRQVVSTWRADGATLTLRLHGSTIGRSEVTLSSDAAVQGMMKQEAKRLQDI